MNGTKNSCEKLTNCARLFAASFFNPDSTTSVLFLTISLFDIDQAVRSDSGGRYDGINYLETIGFAAIYISHGSKGVQYACTCMYKCRPPKTDSSIFLFAIAGVARFSKIYGFFAPWLRFIKLNKMHCLFEKAFSDPQLCESSSFCLVYKTHA